MKKTGVVTPSSPSLAYTLNCPDCGKTWVSIFRPINHCGQCGWRSKNRKERDGLETRLREVPIAPALPKRLSEMLPRRDGQACVTDPNVGLLVRQRRLIMGISQKGLADRIGVSQRTLQNIEKGARFPKTRLEEILHILYPDARPGRDRPTSGSS